MNNALLIAISMLALASTACSNDTAYRVETTNIKNSITC